MFSIIRTPAALFALLLAATPVVAQDLEGTVTTDPRSDLAVYDFHFQGPPRGTAYLFLSPSLSLFPFGLGGLGTLYLDPLSLLPASPLLPLDPGGQGSHRLVLPAGLTSDMPLAFQSVFIDSLFSIRLSQNWSSLLQGVRPLSANQAFSFSFSHNSQRPDFRSQFHGEPGAEGRIEVRDQRGQPVGTGQLQIGPNGQSPSAVFPLIGPVQPGWSWGSSYRRPGQPWVPMGQGNF